MENELNTYGKSIGVENLTLQLLIESHRMLLKQSRRNKNDIKTENFNLYYEKLELMNNKFLSGKYIKISLLKNMTMSEISELLINESNET